jgi:hypothetical protein
MNNVTQQEIAESAQAAAEFQEMVERCETDGFEFTHVNDLAELIQCAARDPKTETLLNRCISHQKREQKRIEEANKQRKAELAAAVRELVKRAS